MKFNIGDRVIIKRASEVYGWKGEVIRVFDANEQQPYCVAAQDPNSRGHRFTDCFDEEELEADRPQWKFW